MSPTTADSTAFFDEVTITPVVDSIVDGGFEQPPLDVNTYQTAPPASAWQFSGTAGVARNGSDFTTNWVEAQNAPEGTQVAYIQDNGSMSQTVYLDPGTYQLSFLACPACDLPGQLSGGRDPGRSQHGQHAKYRHDRPHKQLCSAAYQSSTFTITPATAGHTPSSSSVWTP